MAAFVRLTVGRVWQRIVLGGNGVLDCAILGQDFVVGISIGQRPASRRSRIGVVWVAGSADTRKVVTLAVGAWPGRKGPPQLEQGSLLNPSDRRSLMRGGQERPRRELGLADQPAPRDEWIAPTGSVSVVVSDAGGVFAA